MTDFRRSQPRWKRLQRIQALLESLSGGADGAVLQKDSASDYDWSWSTTLQAPININRGIGDAQGFEFTSTAGSNSLIARCREDNKKIFILGVDHDAGGSPAGTMGYRLNVDGATILEILEAGDFDVLSNALFVAASNGRAGFGTNSPERVVHIASGAEPGFVLEETDAGTNLTKFQQFLNSTGDLMLRFVNDAFSVGYNAYLIRRSTNRVDDHIRYVNNEAREYLDDYGLRLRADGAVAANDAARAFAKITTSDTSLVTAASETTMTDLQFAGAANQVYMVEGLLLVQFASTTHGGLRWRMTGPTGTTIWIWAENAQTIPSQTGSGNSVFSTSGLPARSASGSPNSSDIRIQSTDTIAATDLYLIPFYARVVLGGTAGNVSCLASQDSTDASNATKIIGGTMLKVYQQP